MAKKNRVVGYLRPKNNALFIGMVQMDQIGKSEALNMIVAKFFSDIPNELKAEYLNKAKVNNRY